MSYIGTTKIGKMYLGDTEIAKAYLGTDLVFQNGGSPTPPGPVIEPVFYDYLIWDGVAKIDTTYTPPELFSIRMELGAETNKAAQRVFRVQGGGYVSMIYGSATTSTNRSLSIYYGKTSSPSTGTRAFSSSLYFWLTPNKWGWGNTANSYTRGSLPAPTGGITFGGWESGNPYSGKMSVIRIWDSTAQNASSYDGLANYTNVATFRPCTYNGEAGLWYVEGSTFFGNTAGAGTLSVMNNS